MTNSTISLSKEEASKVVWAIEQVARSKMKNVDESFARQVFDLYEKLHLFADSKQG